MANKKIELRELHLKFKTIHENRAIKAVEDYADSIDDTIGSIQELTKASIKYEQKESEIARQKAIRLKNEAKDVEAKEERITKATLRRLKIIENAEKNARARAKSIVRNRGGSEATQDYISLGRRRGGRSPVGRTGLYPKEANILATQMWDKRIRRSVKLNAPRVPSGATVNRVYHPMLQGVEMGPDSYRSLPKRLTPAHMEMARKIRENIEKSKATRKARSGSAPEQFMQNAIERAERKESSRREIAKKFSKMFKTDNRKFGVQGPYGAEKLIATRKKEDDAVRLSLGQQQQRDYFARAKSNMAKHKANLKERKATIKAFERSPSQIIKGISSFRNNIGSLATVATQAVGELTMFAGAISMVGFMGASAFQKLMSVGDAFASVEKDFLTTSAFRDSIVRTGGIRAGEAFDRANQLNRQYSGMTRAQSGAQLSRASTMIRELNGSVTGANMANLVTAMHGASAITGEDSEKMAGKVLDIAKKGKGAEKLGLAELKLTRNMDSNLEIIADAIKKDPIAGAILRRGTVESAMAGIRNTPKELIENVFGRHQNQVSEAFQGVYKNLSGAMNDNEVITQWSRALTNLTDVLDRVLTRDRLKAGALGASQWGAELAEISGKAMEFSLWFLENSETILNGLRNIGVVWAGVQAIKIGAGVLNTIKDIDALIVGINGLVNGINTLGASGALATALKFVSRWAPFALAGGVAYGAKKTHDAYSVNQNLANKYVQDPRWLDVMADKNDFIETYNFFRDEEAVNTPLLNRAVSQANLQSGFQSGNTFNPNQQVILLQGNLMIGSDVDKTEGYLQSNFGI